MSTIEHASGAKIPPEHFGYAPGPDSTRLEDGRTLPGDPDLVLLLGGALRSRSVPELYSFGPTMILALVSRRVQSMEQDLARLVQAFEAHTAGADTLSRQLEVLQLVQQQAHSSGNADVALGETVEAAGGVTVGELLRRAGYDLGELELKSGTDDVLVGGTLEAMISQKNSELKRHNTGVELQMLRIQSLVQSRGEALSLGTNLLEKLNRSDEEILSNIA